MAKVSTACFSVKQDIVYGLSSSFCVTQYHYCQIITSLLPVPKVHNVFDYTSEKSFIAVSKALCEDICNVTLCITFQRQVVHDINVLTTRVRNTETLNGLLWQACHIQSNFPLNRNSMMFHLKARKRSRKTRLIQYRMAIAHAKGLIPNLIQPKAYGAVQSYVSISPLRSMVGGGVCLCLEETICLLRHRVSYNHAL